MRHLIASLIFGEHTQWIYWSYLHKYGDGGHWYTGKNYKPRRAHLANAFWSHMCGSYYDDLAIYHLIKCFTL